MGLIKKFLRNHNGNFLGAYCMPVLISYRCRDIIGLQQSLVLSGLVHIFGEGNDNVPFQLGIRFVSFFGTL